MMMHFGFYDFGNLILTSPHFFNLRHFFVYPADPHIPIYEPFSSKIQLVAKSNFMQLEATFSLLYVFTTVL